MKESVTGAAGGLPLSWESCVTPGRSNAPGLVIMGVAIGVGKPTCSPPTLVGMDGMEPKLA